MTEPFTPRMQINGEPASADDLRLLVATNYGHFTAMRVENGCVRGLAFHLDRLEHGTRALFGTSIDRAYLRGLLRRALAGETRALS
ncbi:MAG TPA: hypothetical protein VF132_05715, partial [Rudaea sp.]